MVSISQGEKGTLLQLQPNRSASWTQTCRAMGALGAVTLALALFWSLQGFWLIMPFAGLEVMLLWWLSYKVCLATYHQQLVYVSDTTIEVHWGRTHAQRVWRFDRSDAELQVVRPQHSWSPHKLMLQGPQQRVAIGEHLNAEDVQHTLSQLRALGLQLRFSGKTETVAAEGFEVEQSH